LPTAPNGVPQTIIARGNYENTWDLRLTNNIPQFWSHGGQVLEGPSAIPLNEWTHLAISFDGAAKRIYVNGIEAASRDESRTLVYDPAPVPVTIGSDWSENEGSALFNGRVDEVALYNRALTPDEVLSIYNADFLGKNFSQPYFTSPDQLPDAPLGANYTQQLTTILGTPPASFSLSEGLVPPGMTLSSAGVVSGVPSASGIFYFTARATGALGAFTEQACVLRVV
jgi:Concanavalin A-like lectin/glucanases superfamily